MAAHEKIKTIDNKIKQNKTQYNLSRETSNISALWSENVDKYEFLTGENFFSETKLLEKAATVQRFEYSPLCGELKKQTSIFKKKMLRIKQGLWSW